MAFRSRQSVRTFCRFWAFLALSFSARSAAFSASRSCASAFFSAVAAVSKASSTLISSRSFAAAACSSSTDSCRTVMAAARGGRGSTNAVVLSSRMKMR